MRRVLIILIIIFIVLIVGIFALLKINNQPISSDKTNVMIVINDGDGLMSISQKLKANALIRSKYTFLFYTHFLGLKNKLQAGTFRLSPSLSTQDLITKISKGGVSDYWLKIIEGTRLEEIAPLFANGLPKTAKEGYLFPDSYLIPLYFTPEQTLQVIQANFDKKFTQAKKEATNKTLTDQEIVILASILEREARTLKSKQEVAGILLNRLNIKMALQVDASVQYAKDSKIKPATYWQPIKTADLSIISPFNTYKNSGLPPAPICNPGSNSLYAAFHPIDSNYLYYITGHDNLMHYATTLDEHNANIAKYLN